MKCKLVEEEDIVINNLKTFPKRKKRNMDVYLYISFHNKIIIQIEFKWIYSMTGQQCP